MTKPQLTSQISLGNIIQIALILAGLIGAWITMGHKIEASARGVSNNATAIADHELRLRTLENGEARLEERNDAVLQILERIEVRLEHIEQSK